MLVSYLQYNTYNNSGQPETYLLLIQRKAAALRACSKLSKIWKSSLARRIKPRLISRQQLSPCCYNGCKAWAVTPKLEKELDHVDGCYTRMLRTVPNVNWKQHMANSELYGSLREEMGLLTNASELRNLFQGWFFGHRSMELETLIDLF